MLADTKTVRKIVNNIVGVSADWTDKGANDTRLVAWCIGSSNAGRFVKDVKAAFALQGYTNRVKTTGGGGFWYLRINASYNK